MGVLGRAQKVYVVFLSRMHACNFLENLVLPMLRGRSGTILSISATFLSVLCVPQVRKVDIACPDHSGRLDITAKNSPANSSR